MVMKKIIVGFIALTLGVGAMAKTEAELIAGLKAQAFGVDLPKNESRTSGGTSAD